MKETKTMICEKCGDADIVEIKSMQRVCYNCKVLRRRAYAKLHKPKVVKQKKVYVKKEKKIHQCKTCNHKCKDGILICTHVCAVQSPQATL